jgi:hypothetical protein
MRRWGKGFSLRNRPSLDRAAITRPPRSVRAGNTTGDRTPVQTVCAHVGNLPAAVFALPPASGAAKATVEGVSDVTGALPEGRDCCARSAEYGKGWRGRLANPMRHLPEAVSTQEKKSPPGGEVSSAGLKPVWASVKILALETSPRTSRATKHLVRLKVKGISSF